MIFFFFFTNTYADKLIIEPDAGRAPILTAMQNAKSSIDLVMYGFTDKNFINALTQAKKQHKNISVILERHPYKNENENNFALKSLTAAKINLPLPNPDFKFTHQKTLLIDQRYALVMTFNFTNATFTRERNFALLLDDPDEVKEIQSVFNADAEHKKIIPHHKNLIWSPDNSHEKFLELIRSAKSDIKIYAQNITDYQIIGALAKAARDGMNVQIITSDSKKQNRKLDYLKKAGVKIHLSQRYLIHAKVLVIDHQYAVMGSTNLTKPSFESNRELSVVTRDAKIIQELEKTFEQDW